jgi:hypothetical protein
MAVEAGSQGSLAVFRLPVPRQRDEHSTAKRWARPEPARDLVSIDARETDVDKHQIGYVRFSDLQGLHPIVNDAHIVTCYLEQHRHALGCIAIVLDDDNTSASSLNRRGLLTGIRFERHAVRGRDLDDELGP